MWYISFLPTSEKIDNPGTPTIRLGFCYINVVQFCEMLKKYNVEDKQLRDWKLKIGVAYRRTTA